MIGKVCGWFRVIGTAVACVVWLSASSLANQPIPSSISMGEIVTLWEDRASRVSSASYSWTLQDSFRDPEWKNEATEYTKATAAPFVTKSRSCQLKLRPNGEARYTRKGEFWKSSAAISHPSGYYNYTETITFDGTLGMNLLGAGYPGPSMWGYIGTGYLYADNFVTLPAVLAHRPFAQGVIDAFDIREWKVLGSHRAANGRLCVEIARALPPEGRLLKMYLDPAYGYLPVEIQQSFKDYVLDHISVKYVPSVEAEWRCSEWNVTRWFDEGGEIKSAVLATVDMFTANEDGLTSEFTIDFPNGTTIQDSRDKTITVIRHDGSRTKFREDDPSISPLALDVGKPRRLKMGWILGVGVFCVMTATAWVCWRKLRPN
jgi:hypothetical protein